MRRKLIIAVMILSIAAICYAMDMVQVFDKSGKISEPGQVYTLQDGWYTLGTFTTGTTTPAVTARTSALFDVTDTKNETFTIPPQWNNIRLRCSSTTAADSSVFDVFLTQDPNISTGHYTRIATLTFTTGTQTATTSGYEFAHTCVATNAYWLKSAAIMSPGGNYIAEWSIDVCGSRKIGISPTTITNTAILEITGY